MMLLLTHGWNTFTHIRHPNLGRLVQPRCFDSAEKMGASGIVWAADNDAFNTFEPFAFKAMLRKLQGVAGCRFVAAPDVVGLAQATLHLFDEWEPQIRAHGLPVALVAQNGLDPEVVPWERVDALFIGGSTEWKLSRYAHRLTVAAKAEGKWVHMGRVNSRRRIDVARSWGCDSIDGTAFSMYRDTHLPWALSRLAAPPQQMLEGVA